MLVQRLCVSLLYTFDEFCVLFCLLFYRRYGCADIDWKKYDIASCPECTDCSVTIFEVVGYGFHVNAVGEYKTLKAHLFAQQGIDNFFGKRRRHVCSAVVGIDLKMCYHDASYSFVNHPFEWI